MEIVILIGARPYTLAAAQAEWLNDRIRATCVVEIGRTQDPDAIACLQLAEVIHEDLEAGEHREPIELGRSHAWGDRMCSDRRFRCGTRTRYVL